MISFFAIVLRHPIRNIEDLCFWENLPIRKPKMQHFIWRFDTGSRFVHIFRFLVSQFWHIHQIAFVESSLLRMVMNIAYFNMLKTTGIHDLFKFSLDPGDYDKLAYVWTSWRNNVGRPIKPLYLENMKLLNKAAQANSLFLFLNNLYYPNMRILISKSPAGDF